MSFYPSPSQTPLTMAISAELEANSGFGTMPAQQAERVMNRKARQHLLKNREKTEEYVDQNGETVNRRVGVKLWNKMLDEIPKDPDHDDDPKKKRGRPLGSKNKVQREKKPKKGKKKAEAEDEEEDEGVEVNLEEELAGEWEVEVNGQARLDRRYVKAIYDNKEAALELCRKVVGTGDYEELGAECIKMVLKSPFYLFEEDDAIAIKALMDKSGIMDEGEGEDVEEEEEGEVKGDDEDVDEDEDDE